MAREESDREDILREATALVDRAELHVDGFAETIVFGFRRNGALSLFVTQDEVYQFDTKNTLRRGYLGTRLLKADRGQLMEISRVRSAQETTLVTRPLPREEQDRLLERLSLRLEQLRDAIVRRQAFRVVGSVSASGEDSVARFTHWLETMIGPIGVARQAGVC